METSKFNLRKQDRTRVVDSEHIHVDNGGYSFELIQYEYLKSFKEWSTFLEISEGFYGYSESKLSFHEGINPETLEQIGKFFIRAAGRLRETGICRKGE
jgi:hypothetical protein